MLDPELLKKVNGGRCFALVGAGPSAEIGYSSWKHLAQGTRDEVLKTIQTADAESYEQFLAKENYPALFSQAEDDLGNREVLISIVRRLLRPTPRRVSSPIYQFLAKWPFACYLTTNYDDELHNRLTTAGYHFQTVQNTREDLALLRDDTSNLIVKIHSDCDHVNDIVLTSRDYDRVLTSPEGAHIREKMKQVFGMRDVLIIGHSMKDPDLQLAMQAAKHTASPRHPLYMIIGNVTTGEMREFHERYNIRILPYRNPDGLHKQLHQIVAIADHFVAARDVRLPASPAATNDEISAATSLLIFRRLRQLAMSDPVVNSLGPTLLTALATAKCPLSVEQVARQPAVAPLVSTQNLYDGIEECVKGLTSQGLVVRDNGGLAISATGLQLVQQVASLRKLEEEQAYGQFVVDLRRALPEISLSDCGQAKDALRDALVQAFRSRGIAMANVIIANQSLGSDDLCDIFREISSCAARFADFDVRAAFIEASHAFLVQPQDVQKKYLASVSQGFFLYHMAGLDPTCAAIRKTLFADTCWFLDSSVMIPLLALGSYNHDYAKDLFGKLTSVRAKLFTTEMLLKETWHHLEWAIAFVKACPIESPHFLAAALVERGYKQNLFIDGYIRLAAEGTVGTFGDYLEYMLPNGVSQELFLEKTREYGISALRASELEGFVQEHWGDIEVVKEALTRTRQERGTYRTDLQVQAEAEVLQIIRKTRDGEYDLGEEVNRFCRVYFVSQSHLLDTVSADENVVTWTPEAVYRYVTSLAQMELDPQLLQQCMLHEYYYAGVSFIDRVRYNKFFGPCIQQSKLDYSQQVERYLDETMQTHQRQSYDADFDRTPDLQKPFFVSQMAWRITRRAEEKVDEAGKQIDRAMKDAEAAEARARAAEERSEKAHTARVRAEQEANRLRNLQDPKHAKKRMKQAKKRARKKRK